MVRWPAAILFLACCCLLVSCATKAPPPSWRLQAMTLVDELSLQAAPRLFPEEYRNIVETFEHGEAVLHVQQNDKEADAYYLLALEKGDLLKAELQQLKRQARGRGAPAGGGTGGPRRGGAAPAGSGPGGGAPAGAKPIEGRR